MTRRKRIVLSEHQYGLLKMIKETYGPISFKALQFFDERPLNSLIKRDYIRKQGKRLVITDAGERIVRLFDFSSPVRTHKNSQLGRWLDDYINKGVK